MKSILIVEDDNFLRTAIAEILSDNYKVNEAENGKSARDILKMKDYDMILSDIQMPFLSGVELLEWAKDNKDHIPFVLMTGFAHILETQTAAELGADGFIAKPFTDDELLELIETVFKEKMDERSQPEEELKQAKAIPENQYCRASIEDFVCDKEFKIDVFIKLRKGKFIKIAHKGGKLETERVENYKKKGLTELYIRKEDFPKIIDFNIKLSKLVAKSRHINKEKKDRFLIHTGQVILEQAFVAGVDEESFEYSKEFITTSVDLLTEDEQSFHLLESLSSHVDHLYAHSLGVSMYSVMIARKMDWTSSSTLFKLGFSGIMHDIGKKEIDPKMLLKARSEFTYDEVQIYESHPIRGKAILESLKSVPSEVVDVAYEHHENQLGHGYPRRLKKHDIHPMARVVAVADEFCSYTIKGANSPGIGAINAIGLMEELKSDLLDPHPFKALKLLFSKEA